MSAAGANRRLQRQIEFVRDTEPVDVHEVIVKVKSQEREEVQLLATVATALRRRALYVFCARPFTCVTRDG